MKRTESIADFLARGGQIKKIPANQTSTVKPDSIKTTTGGGPAVIMSMDDADLYYGESKLKKAKKKVSTIDISALPEELRKKYVDEVVYGEEDDTD